VENLPKTASEPSHIHTPPRITDQHPHSTWTMVIVPDRIEKQKAKLRTTTTCTRQTIVSLPPLSLYICIDPRQTHLDCDSSIPSKCRRLAPPPFLLGLTTHPGLPFTHALIANLVLRHPLAVRRLMLNRLESGKPPLRRPSTESTKPLP
jgi:hypothetical protein